MAVQQIREPFVQNREVVRSTPNLLNLDGTSNVGGVIVAPTGPRLAYISGPQDFLDRYTVDGQVPRNADPTFINAYYLSFSAGLVIARSMNTTAVNGLFFTFKSNKESKLLINSDSEAIWGILFNGVYYWCNNGSTVWSDYIDLLRSITDNDGNFTYSSEKIDAIKLAGETANVACQDFNDLATKLAANLTEYDGSKYEAVYSSSVGGIIFTPGIDELFSINQQVQDTLVGMMINLITSATGVNSLEAHEINYKDGVALTESEVLKFSFPNGIEGNWAFTFGTMAYYHGAIDRSNYEDYSLISCNSLEDVANSISGIAGMTAEETKKNEEITIYFSKGNRLYIADSTSGLNYNIYVQQQDEPNSIDMSNMMFAVYPDDPQDSDKYKMTVQPDDNELFYITLTDGDTTESYTVSLLVDAVDQSGSNAFIENLNALGIGYTFVTNPNYPEADLYNQVPKATQVFSFGDSGLDLSASKSTTCKVNALYALEDQELYDIEYLCAFGEMNLQFIKNYVLVGKNNFWFTPVDIPYDKTNANSIKGYFLNVDSSNNVIGMGPFDKNTGLTGWMNYIACSTLYYTKIMNNRAAGKEFAPVFDITNGILDFTNPVYMLGKEDRVKLLNFKCPVNFTKFDQRSNVYYLNDNRTHQPETNILSEEQNRRITNKIHKDANRLMQRFKGRYNTTTTRADVVSLIQYYFQTQIMSQQYAPAEYEIICDESNNTNEIITSNWLALTIRVRLYNAIKFIDILQDIYPLGVDFTSEGTGSALNA